MASSPTALAVECYRRSAGAVLTRVVCGERVADVDALGVADAERDADGRAEVEVSGPPAVDGPGFAPDTAAATTRSTTAAPVPILVFGWARHHRQARDTDPSSAGALAADIVGRACSVHWSPDQ